MAIKYVSNADGRGWLVVRHANGRTYPPLPQYLKVEVQRVEGEREYFKILEGRNIRQEASVKIPGRGRSYLINGSHRAAAKVKFKIGAEELWYGDQLDKGPIQAITDGSNPPPTGTHDLEIPYEIHKLGTPYLADSKFATTWFRIGHSGDRFLHPGRISAGCTTVKEVSTWTDIYSYLIRARKGDSKSVGTIVIES